VGSFCAVFGKFLRSFYAVTLLKLLKIIHFPDFTGFSKKIAETGVYNESFLPQLEPVIAQWSG